MNYRGFTQPSGIRSVYFQYEVGEKLYVFIDYASAGVDTLKLDSKWNDRPIAVYNKSNNVKVAGEVTTSEIGIIVSPFVTIEWVCRVNYWLNQSAPISVGV